MIKNELENLKIKAARSGQRKIKISPQSPYGLPTMPQNRNLAIYGIAAICDAGGGEVLLISCISAEI